MTIFDQVTKFVDDSPTTAFGCFVVLWTFAANFLCFRTRVIATKEDD